MPSHQMPRNGTGYCENTGGILPSHVLFQQTYHMFKVGVFFLCLHTHSDPNCWFRNWLSRGVVDALVFPLVLFIFLLCAVRQCLQLFLYLNYQDKAFSCSYQAYSLLGPVGSGSIGRTAVADMRQICRAGVRQHCKSCKWPL